MSESPLNVAVVGAGICGLCTGLALAKAGHQVTLIERDAPPPEGAGVWWAEGRDGRDAPLMLTGWMR